jgi:hypothetical protein
MMGMIKTYTVHQGTSRLIALVRRTEQKTCPETPRAGR